MRQNAPTPKRPNPQTPRRAESVTHSLTHSHNIRGIFNIGARLQQNFARVESILRSIQDETEWQARIAAAAELRRHIELAQKTLEAASRVEAVRAFEIAVMNILEESGAQIRQRVIAKLNHRLKLLEEQPES